MVLQFTGSGGLPVGSLVPGAGAVRQSAARHFSRWFPAAGGSFDPLCGARFGGSMAPPVDQENGTGDSLPMPRPSVLIVAEHASFRFGGEAALPLHYFRVLTRRKLPVRLITHSRVRDELLQIFPDEQHLITYIEDGPVQIWMYRLGKHLPDRISNFTAGFVSRVYTQFQALQVARRLVKSEGVTVVHQPMPVSPREPTLLRKLGVPVVIGPMNGNIDFPLGFRREQHRFVHSAVRVARSAAQALTKFLLPGKLEAAALIVANARTRSALPSSYHGRIYTIPENGVDLQLWKPLGEVPRTDAVCRCVFVGRLVDWKAVDLLVSAFLAVPDRKLLALNIVGDGPQREKLVAQAREAGALASTEGEPGGIFFSGWRPQGECAEILRRSDVFVLPSLMECGGAVVLEAMAVGLPVIATDWGGPADYLDAECGILVQPDDAAQFKRDLGAAMVRLATSPALRARMGAQGREKVAAQFDWERKAEQMLSIYQQVAS
jgi:glycosyltransferase involved in cell wall biosynthesis